MHIFSCEYSHYYWMPEEIQKLCCQFSFAAVLKVRVNGASDSAQWRKASFIPSLWILFVRRLLCITSDMKTASKWAKRHKHKPVLNTPTDRVKHEVWLRPPLCDLHWRVSHFGLRGGVNAIGDTWRELLSEWYAATQSVTQEILRGMDELKIVCTEVSWKSSGVLVLTADQTFHVLSCQIRLCSRPLSFTSNQLEGCIMSYLFDQFI